jgi:hypothetical protein
MTSFATEKGVCAREGENVTRCKQAEPETRDDGKKRSVSAMKAGSESRRAANESEDSETRGWGQKFIEIRVPRDADAAVLIKATASTRTGPGSKAGDEAVATKRCGGPFEPSCSDSVRAGGNLILRWVGFRAATTHFFPFLIHSPNLPWSEASGTAKRIHHPVKVVR